MKSVFLVGIHCVGKTTLLYNNEYSIVSLLKKKGYNAKAYTLDNHDMYINLIQENRENWSLYDQQMLRYSIGVETIKQAIEDNPEIALFDRSLYDNLIYSEIFEKYKQMKPNELKLLRRVTHTSEAFELCRKGIYLFLKPPFETVIEQLQNREREERKTYKKSREDAINTVLTHQDFLKDLYDRFNVFYSENMILSSPVYTLEKYDAALIYNLLLQNNIIQKTQ